jgi:ubiquinone/menaquinone biosynthesis C-methylase UbiE
MSSAAEGTPAPTDPAVWSELWPELWRRHGDRIEAMDDPPGAAMLHAAALRTGEKVLDVGCGAGSSTVEAGRLVGPTGAVVGVDISAPMIELTEARARAASLHNVTLVVADAQTHDFGQGAFDVVISRFGVMFFADTVAAFANLARSLRPGGRLSIVVPRAPQDDPWISTILTAVAPHVGEDDVDEIEKYGSFGLGEGERMDRVLAEAGFRDVDRRAVTLPIRVGTDADDVVDYLLDEPEIEAVLERTTGAQRSEALAALRIAIAPHAGPDGVVMETSVWVVTARK